MLERDALDDVYQSLELPLIPVLVAVERAGVRIDAPALAAQSQRIEQELSRRTPRDLRARGQRVQHQLAEAARRRSCSSKLQLPVLRRTGASRAPSTAVEVLEELALATTCRGMILEWRALMKLKGTYIDALPQLVNPETGRVHTCFNQAVAATGRLSSSDPNLQNIPIRTELGREIRRAFIAEPGYVLISADYSQIELRVLAHLAGDETLIEAFRRGDDIHDQTALKVFGADSGMDPHRPAQHREDDQLRAALRQNGVHAGERHRRRRRRRRRSSSTPTSPASRASAGSSIARSTRRATSGVVKTMFGRRRLVPELNSRNGQVRSAAERVAVNMPIQGTAADILKRAMIDVHDALGGDARRADDPDRARRAPVRGSQGAGR